MSQWTHVAGVIRFDGVAALGVTLPDLGIMAVYDSPDFDDNPDFDACDIPCGSEGSLRYHTWQSPRPSSVAQWTVSIFGDLRDYDNAQEVIDYFARITKGAMVRQASYVVQVEGQPSRMFVWDDKADVFTECIWNLPSNG